MGETGLSDGPHLHFEVRINNNPVNPRDFVYTGSGNVTNPEAISYFCNSSAGGIDEEGETGGSEGGGTGSTGGEDSQGYILGEFETINRETFANEEISMYQPGESTLQLLNEILNQTNKEIEGMLSDIAGYFDPNFNYCSNRFVDFQTITDPLGYLDKQIACAKNYEKSINGLKKLAYVLWGLAQGFSNAVLDTLKSLPEAIKFVMQAVVDNSVNFFTDLGNWFVGLITGKSLTGSVVVDKAIQDSAFANKLANTAWKSLNDMYDNWINPQLNDYLKTIKNKDEFGRLEWFGRIVGYATGSVVSITQLASASLKTSSQLAKMIPGYNSLTNAARLDNVFLGTQNFLARGANALYYYIDQQIDILGRSLKIYQFSPETVGTRGSDALNFIDNATDAQAKGLIARVVDNGKRGKLTTLRISKKITDAGGDITKTLRYTEKDGKVIWLEEGRWQHILSRHGQNAPLLGNNGKFLNDQEIQKLIFEAIKNSPGNPSSSVQGAMIYEYDFGRQIGLKTDYSSPTSKIFIFQEPNGKITTAYPMD